MPISVELFSFHHIKTKRIYTMAPLFWTVGCLYGASSVMLGAFGAHGLKKRISDPTKLTNWSTAAHYQVSVITELIPGKMCLFLMKISADDPFWCSAPKHHRCTPKQDSSDPLHSGHDHVQRKYLLARLGFSTFQGSGTCHSSWWTVPHWWMGCAGVQSRPSANCGHLECIADGKRCQNLYYMFKYHLNKDSLLKQESDFFYAFIKTSFTHLLLY